MIPAPPPSATPLPVEVAGLEKTYLLGTLAVPALRGVDLAVTPGEFVAVMGPSGCGKTTLLNLVGLLDGPTRGTVRIDGRDVSLLPDDAKADLRRDRLGFVFQFYNLLPMLTAFENVEVPLNFKGLDREERRVRVEELLERVDLANRGHHLPAELSGGEQQRVTIARALANRPSIVLLDEPTGDLDSRTGAEIMDLVFRLNREEGTTFIMVTHDLALAQRADRILVMSDGKIVEELRPGAAVAPRGETAARKASKRSSARKPASSSRSSARSKARPSGRASARKDKKPK